MTGHDDLVARIVSLAKLPGAGCRREVERELRTHVEEMIAEAESQGYSDSVIQEMLAARFGNAQEVAAAFAFVYRRDRLLRSISCWATLVISSLVAVAIVVGSIQSVATIFTGASFGSLSADMQREVFGLVAIVLGYCSVCLGERLFSGSSAKIVLPCAVLLVLAIPLWFSWVPAGHMPLPLVAFSCAVSGRLLQSSRIPLLWVAGIAGPLFIAWVFLGSLPAAPYFPWLIWLGLTTSCKALQGIVQLFERFVFDQSSVQA
jgi:hypothetical protein